MSLCLNKILLKVIYLSIYLLPLALTDIIGRGLNCTKTKNPVINPYISSNGCATHYYLHTT